MKKKLFLRKETVALLAVEQSGILGGGGSEVVPALTRTCRTGCGPCETMYMRSCVVITDFTCPESAQQCVVITRNTDCQIVSDYCVKTEICVVTDGY